MCKIVSSFAVDITKSISLRVLSVFFFNVCIFLLSLVHILRMNLWGSMHLYIADIDSRPQIQSSIYYCARLDEIMSLFIRCDMIHTWMWPDHFMYLYVVDLFPCKCSLFLLGVIWLTREFDITQSTVCCSLAPLQTYMHANNHKMQQHSCMRGHVIWVMSRSSSVTWPMSHKLLNSPCRWFVNVLQKSWGVHFFNDTPFLFLFGICQQTVRTYTTMYIHIYSFFSTPQQI